MLLPFKRICIWRGVCYCYIVNIYILLLSFIGIESNFYILFDSKCGLSFYNMWFIVNAQRRIYWTFLLLWYPCRCLWVISITVIRKRFQLGNNLLSAQCVSSIGQIIKSVCVCQSVSQWVSEWVNFGIPSISRDSQKRL